MELPSEGFTLKKEFSLRKKKGAKPLSLYATLIHIKHYRFAWRVLKEKEEEQGIINRYQLCTFTFFRQCTLKDNDTRKQLIEIVFFSHILNTEDKYTSGRKEVFYLMTHSTHLVTVIWRLTYGKGPFR